MTEVLQSMGHDVRKGDKYYTMFPLDEVTSFEGRSNESIMGVCNCSEIVAFLTC